jgi:hypothetical protein
MKDLPTLAVVLLCLAFSLYLTGCATPGKPEKVGCEADIEWQVTSEAQITQFDCSPGAFKGDPALLFEVGIQNVADKPLRYRLNIFLLDMDKAAGHLVPRKGKPPVLEPGKTDTVKIPFIKTSEMSKKILVVVKTVGY